MTPGLLLYFHSTLSPVLFCLSSQRPSENSNKKPQLRVGREWTAQRQTNLSLLCICWPQRSLFFFSLTLYTDSLPLSLPPPPLSNNHSCFSYTSQWLQMFSHLPWRDCEKDSSTCVKRCKKKKKSMIPCERFQLWPSVSSQPDSKTCCRALLKGQFHRTIAHITPNPSDTRGNPWVTMTANERLWIMNASAEVEPCTKQRKNTALTCILFDFQK